MCIRDRDSATTAEIMEMICGFARKFRQTIILVTHDPEMAAYADRVVCLLYTSRCV